MCPFNLGAGQIIKRAISFSIYRLNNLKKTFIYKVDLGDQVFGKSVIRQISKFLPLSNPFSPTLDNLKEDIKNFDDFLLIYFNECLYLNEKVNQEKLTSIIKQLVAVQS